MGRGASSSANGSNLLFGSRSLAKNNFELTEQKRLAKQEQLHAQKTAEFLEIVGDKVSKQTYAHLYSKQALASGTTTIEFQGNRIVVRAGGHVSYWKDNKLDREDGPALVDKSLGREEWHQNGELHREGGPAESIVLENFSSRKWYQHGKLHRDEDPAVVDSQGEIWYQHGELHREDGPAVCMINGPLAGLREWYSEGLKHRENGPACYNKRGQEEWYEHGSLHRIGGPARTDPQFDKQEWFENDARHRLDGPAVVQAGREFFFIRGKKVASKDYGEKVREFYKAKGF